MRIRWLGHSCFLIETGNVKILTDPYNSSTGYKASFPEVDLVLVSHEHGDHNCVKKVKAFKKVLKEGTEEFDGVKITAIPYFHDNAQGAKRGKISLFRIEAEDMVKKNSKRWGGFFTIGPDEAKPNIAIPMHYKTKYASFFLKTVLRDLDAFVKDHPYEQLDVLEITKENLPEPTKIVSLNFNPILEKA